MESNSSNLAIPKDLSEQIKKAAEQTGLPVSDVMRRSICLGLPLLNKSVHGENDLLAERLADTWEKLVPPPEINWDEIESR